MIIMDLPSWRTSSAVPNGLCGDFTAPRHDSEYVSEDYAVQSLCLPRDKGWVMCGALLNWGLHAGINPGRCSGSGERRSGAAVIFMSIQSQGR